MIKSVFNKTKLNISNDYTNFGMPVRFPLPGLNTPGLVSLPILSDSRRLGFPSLQDKQLRKEKSKFHRRQRLQTFRIRLTAEEVHKTYIMDLETWNEYYSDYKYLGDLNLVYIYRRISQHLDTCGLKWARYSCECKGINKIIPWYCHSRYCSNVECVQERIAIAQARLKSLDIRSKRVLHFSIGSTELDKTSLQHVVNKVLNRIPQKYKVLLKTSKRALYVKVFDISKGKSGKQYLHYHILLLTKAGVPVDIREFINIMRYQINKISKVTTFSFAGYRNTNKVINYLAKRIAGEYGHKKEGFYYIKDIMSLKDYIKQYHNKTFITSSFPEGLTSKVRTDQKPRWCYDCNSYITFREFTDNPEEEEFKPPN